jgi:hypothetical protein
MTGSIAIIIFGIQVPISPEIFEKESKILTLSFVESNLED